MSGEGGDEYVDYDDETGKILKEFEEELKKELKAATKQNMESKKLADKLESRIKAEFEDGKQLATYFSKEKIKELIEYEHPETPVKNPIEPENSWVGNAMSQITGAFSSFWPFSQNDDAKKESQENSNMFSSFWPFYQNTEAQDKQKLLQRLYDERIRDGQREI
jgi:hypothetical protein